MSTPARRHLKPVEEPTPIALVNTATGEQVGTLADVQAAHEAEYNALQGKYRAALADITRLKKDGEAEARRHELWAMAETAHTWWRLACWHPGVRFGAEAFYEALPRLKEPGGLLALLQAIAGAAFDPGTKRMKNGRMKRFDDWELICRSPGKRADFAERVPGGGESEAWKAWLVQRIQSAFEAEPSKD